MIGHIIIILLLLAMLAYSVKFILPKNVTVKEPVKPKEKDKPKRPDGWYNLPKLPDIAESTKRRRICKGWCNHGMLGDRI